MKFYLSILCALIFTTSIQAQYDNVNKNKFKQLHQELPDANVYRTASGTPGHKYWQQKVDYVMDIKIDEQNNVLYGKEDITYTNNSPDALSYLWIQLDQNVRAKSSSSYLIRQSRRDKYTEEQVESMKPWFDGGHNITSVTDSKGRKLEYTINQTMMRLEIPTLNSGETMSFRIEWNYNINNTNEVGGRSGYEPFEDGNNVYCIAQFFPRLCKYYDVYGWQNKQFLGRGEFTLEFGDYDVSITVPSDHLVASTGTLTNKKEVLSKKELKRLEKAEKEFEQPVLISTLDDAENRSKKQSKTEKTWNFIADNVRDFAFATSRRFIWDALNTKISDNKNVLAQSMWVKEGDCLWSKYSTKAVAHTLKWYSHYTVEYPYPTAWSIDGSMGMEYPMIAFNYGRCEDDGTYSQRMKYGHIGVIIHEIGHNFFPMIINSDERQWTWMDEGLNTFVQYLTEQQFERNYPSRRGEPASIVDYMKGDKSNISPIMTNSESIHQFGNNAYAKPATALNILRETVIGRELFDKAFKGYSETWAFKTPTPADFFRYMEDATAVDLDWFWRGWFYSTDHVDLAIESFTNKSPEPSDPSKKYSELSKEKKEQPEYIGRIRNEKDIKKTYNEQDPTLNDFYTTYDADKPDVFDQEAYTRKKASRKTKRKSNDKYVYEISFKNKGGIPMPIIIDLVYIDGSKETKRIPAEIWKFGSDKVTKAFATEKPVKEVILDPYLETADTDRNDNYYPKRDIESKFDRFTKRSNDGWSNPMQRANEAAKKKNRL